MPDGLDALRRYEVVSAGDPYLHPPKPAPVPVEPHPAPDVPCRPAAPDEIPTSAARLAKAAAAAGWDVKVTYARGTPMLGGELVDSLVVRLRAKYRMAVGVWVQGRWTSGWHWSAAHSYEGAEGYVQVGYRDLVKHVKGSDGQLTLA
jgi:hypothetical protein